jgi:SAM-dependent methyltransferase
MLILCAEGLGINYSKMLRVLIKRALSNNCHFKRFRAKRFFRQYQEISAQEAEAVTERLSNSWKDTSIPDQQFQIVNDQLTDYRNGHPDPTFDSLTNILTRNIPELNSCKILEIGCSSGYLSEIFRIKGIFSTYQGCDYSPAFIKSARKLYPYNQWDVEDATALSYQDDSFNLVISGCCVLHIFDYAAAIAQAARVARKYVVFHRTPVFNNKGPVFYLKHAYGVKMLEIHFCEKELSRLMTSEGLSIIDEEIIDSFFCDENSFSIKTYLCVKS